MLGIKKGDYSNEDNVLPQRFLFDDLNYNLGQNRWKIYTPHLQIKDRKMARFGFCAASSLIWGGGFILFKIVAPSAAGITVLYLRTGGRMGQRKGHDLLFLFGWDEMVTPKSDCHLNSKYMHMIGDLYLKVASERKQKTENIVGSTRTWTRKMWCTMHIYISTTPSRANCQHRSIIT